MNARVSSLSALVAIAMMVSVVGPAQASLGVGVHYLRNLGDITNDGAVDLDQNSASLIGSIMSGLGPLKLDGQVEYIFDYIGTGDEMWQPSLWALMGGFIYGGAGMGIGYTNDEWQSNPFYALRAGVNLPLGGLALDCYGSYQFQSDSDLENLTGEDLDSVTFAVILRF